LAASSWSPNSSQWYHIAVTREGSSLKQFVDGTQLGTTVTDNTNYADGLTWIGYGGSGYFNGYMSDVRITKGLARYTANFTPPTAALQG